MRHDKDQHADSQAPVKALDRGLQLLREIARRESARTADLVHATGVPLPTVHRLLLTLEASGLVERDPDTHGWRIGVEAFRIGSAFLRYRRLATIGRPAMRTLAEEIGETVNLATLEIGEVAYISQYESHAPMRAFFRPGQRTPAFCSAAGKAMLAALAPADQVRRLSGLTLVSLTPNTITTRDRLIEDLKATRIRGWAIDDEEHTQGMRCVAAAILNEFSEPVAALSISGPVVRIPDAAVPRLGSAVHAAAGRITASFGGAQ